MRFPVKRVGAWDFAECVYAQTRADVAPLRKWSDCISTDGNPLKFDAAEYGDLAQQRWIESLEKGRVAKSLDEVRIFKKDNPHSEVRVLLLARAAWFRSGVPMGLCLLRRTWCNNLCLEYLAAHPLATDDHISGIGSGLLYEAICFARSLRVRDLWGEATALSRGFYENVFDLAEVRDLFCASKRRRLYFQNQCDRKWEEVAIRARRLPGDLKCPPNVPKT